MIIELWTGSDLGQLAEVLHACVHAGASVSFVLPFSKEDAEIFWRDQVLPAAKAGTRFVFIARLEGQIAGTVQLDLATPPNQPHRGEIKKLLVHPEARRRGIAKALMNAAHDHARGAGRTMLTLDTAAGSFAEPLYLSLGYVPVGAIPRYAYNYNSTVVESTIIMYKDL